MLPVFVDRSLLPRTSLLRRLAAGLSLFGRLYDAFIDQLLIALAPVPSLGLPHRLEVTISVVVHHITAGVRFLVVRIYKGLYGVHLRGVLKAFRVAPLSFVARPRQHLAFYECMVCRNDISWTHQRTFSTVHS